MTSQSGNRLLDLLSSPYRDALVGSMEPVALPLSTVLYEAGKTPRYAHFVTAGLVSVVDFMKDGDGVEVGLIGKEGLVEALHLLGRAKAPMTAFVQVEGAALRIPFAAIQKDFLEYPPMRSIILAYVQTQAFAGSQLAACNRLHEVEPRMARWLLMVEDRLGESSFSLTQEFLGQMIGARRTTVTLTARRLQQAGMIAYSRGRMHILSRKGLEGVACECYPIVRKLAQSGYTSQN